MSVLRLVTLLVAVASWAGPVRADQGDPVLEGLVRDALAARPELREAELRARAAETRAPQVGAMPDPMVAVGIQNDGFDSIEIGSMETSFLSVMLSQELPWPGKRDLRRRVAALAASGETARIARLRLSTEAAVRRGYLELLLVRDRLALLEKLARLWQKSEELARSRYEVASAPQSDILRAQLERHRLAQRRIALTAEEQTRVQALNRLVGRAPDTAIATTRSVRDLPEPPLPPAGEELRDTEAKSPELRVSALAIRRADAAVELAKKERLPDFAVSAGVMPRGGLEPMWTANVSMNLPWLWGRGKRDAAISEARLTADADRQASAAVAQTLRQRVAERRTALAAAKETLRLYRDGLLVQSAATVESTLAQYRVGKVTFASVLEAIAGNIADEEAYLAVIADAQRVAIAGAEASLEAMGASAAPAASASVMPAQSSAASGSGGM